MGFGTGFVHYVDSLVGEITFRDVAFGQIHAGTQCFVRVAHHVMPFVVRGYVAQDLQRLFLGSLLDDYFLKAPFESSVALDVLAVFVERGGAYALQLSACQRRFQDIGRIETSLCAAGSHYGVYLVDEHNHVLVCCELFEKRFYTLFEFAAVFGSGHQRRYV